MPAVLVGARPLSLLLLAAAGACLPQSDECAEYVACQQAYDSTVDVAPYQPGGSCWASPQAAAACDDQCEQALTGLRQLPDLPPECAAPQ